MLHDASWYDSVYCSSPLRHFSRSALWPQSRWKRWSNTSLCSSPDSWQATENTLPQTEIYRSHDSIMMSHGFTNIKHFLKTSWQSQQKSIKLMTKLFFLLCLLKYVAICCYHLWTLKTATCSLPPNHRNGFLEIVQSLCEARANVEQVDEDGTSTVEIAQRSGRSVIETLLTCQKVQAVCFNLWQ